MFCVYAFKQLVGENKINYHLRIVLKIRLEILFFLTFDMNEMQHQQNHIWFKGKNLKINHINAIKYMF